MHIHQKFLLRVSITGNDTDDITDTNFKQCTGNTDCQLTVPVAHRITGSPSGLQQTATPHQ